MSELFGNPEQVSELSGNPEQLPYTPTTEEIRRAVTSFNEYFDHPRAAEFDGDLFDRWLAEVKEEAFNMGYRACPCLED